MINDYIHSNFVTSKKRQKRSIGSLTTNSDEYWDRFYQRVRKSCRTYFFEKIVNEGLSRHTLFKLFGWIKNDLIILFTLSLSVILNIRKYGRVIRSEYSLSYVQQAMRLTYLTFYKRAHISHFRTRLLFKQRNWEKADEFIYTQHRVQKDLANRSSVDEEEVIDNKFKFYRYCKPKGISTPDVFLVFDQGKKIFENTSVGSLERDLFGKKCKGGKGMGARKFTFAGDHYTDLSGNAYSRDQMIDFFRKYSEKEGAVLIQPALTNHTSWKKFTSGGLATCRLVTGIRPDDSEIVPLFCCLKMPVGLSDVDNYAKGAIICSVDLNTGSMGRGVSLNPIEGKFEFTHHVDTGQKFEGSVLPHWQNLLDFTLEAHKQFRTIFVGWDVALTTKGCCLIEGNITWSSGSYEIPFQDSLKKTIYPELFERWMEKFDETV